MPHARPIARINDLGNNQQNIDADRCVICQMGRKSTKYMPGVPAVLRIGASVAMDYSFQLWRLYIVTDVETRSNCDQYEVEHGSG